MKRKVNSISDAIDELCEYSFNLDSPIGITDETARLARIALREQEERGKGCEYCLEFEDLPEHFENGVAVGKVFDTCIQPDEKGRWHIELPQGADIGIRFCPMCGKRLEVEP